MKRLFVIIVLALAASAGLPGAHAQAAQDKDAARDATREKLRQLLDTAGQRKDVTVTFRQPEKQPYYFVGVMRDGLTNAESLEIVISVTSSETISFRV